MVWFDGDGVSALAPRQRPIQPEIVPHDGCWHGERISLFAQLGYLPLLHMLVEERVGERRQL